MTFHSLCLRIIKENLEFTRLKRNYRLLDTFDQKYLVFRNFHKFKNIEGIDELLSKGGSWKRSDEICTYINHLSEEMVDIEALQSDDNPWDKNTWKSAVCLIKKCLRKEI